MAVRALWRWVLVSARFASWLASQFDRHWCATATANLHNAPFCKMSASQSQAPFVAATASRPAGLQKRRYAKLPTLMRARQPSALPGRWRALRAVACRPFGVLAPRHQSGATRMVLVSGFAEHHGICPRPPLGLACFAASAARSARPPPEGAPSEPRQDTPPDGGGLLVLGLGLFFGT